MRRTTTQYIYKYEFCISKEIVLTDKHRPHPPILAFTDTF